MCTYDCIRGYLCRGTLNPIAPQGMLDVNSGFIGGQLTLRYGGGR